MRRFDHIGLPTAEAHPGELYIPETKVWITDPWVHPQRIEFLRFEPDSQVTGLVRDLPHVAFQVDVLEDELGGGEILLGPFQATPLLRVVFVRIDGAVFEFMENKGDPHWFPGQ